jgi:hypothetical protein
MDLHLRSLITVAVEMRPRADYRRCGVETDRSEERLRCARTSPVDRE